MKVLRPLLASLILLIGLAPQVQQHIAKASGCTSNGQQIDSHAVTGSIYNYGTVYLYYSASCNTSWAVYNVSTTGYANAVVNATNGAYQDSGIQTGTPVWTVTSPTQSSSLGQRACGYARDKYGNQTGSGCTAYH